MLVILLPLLGGVAGLFFRKQAHVVTSISIAAALILSIARFTAGIEGEEFTGRFEWLPGHMFGWFLDGISSPLISLVLLISLLVHIFSIYYMEDDRGKHRYFAFLGFFTFSMLGLLAADHIVLVFVFWELVGFSSFLLIGFWYKVEDNAYNGRYAFIANRIADVPFLIAVLIIWNFGASPFVSDFSKELLSGPWTVWVGFGLLMGAMGKSAQFPFYTWLPRAMSGPTPVSALIHAATMVAAGVYLLVRVEAILSFEVQVATAIVGTVTMFMAAYSALVQFDIKKVLAYSTVSQLGYMVMAVGVGAADMAYFHLWTHAFFKAGLFLVAGVVIHTMAKSRHIPDPQDMRQMGDLRGRLKFTHIAFLIFALALSGLPFFAGFFSKEGILIASLNFASANQSSLGIAGYLFPVLGFTTVFLTAFYMFRQYFMVFGTKKRVANSGEKEPLGLVVAPLLVLAAGSFWVFYEINPLAHEIGFISAIFGSPKPNPSTAVISLISVALAVAGILSAFALYKKDRLPLLSWQGKLAGRLSNRSFFLDEVYEKRLIPAFDWVAVKAGLFDRRLIDRLIDLLGIAFIVLSKGMDLIDKLLVDGLVKLIAYLADVVGRFTRFFTAARMQLHILWLIVGVIFIYLLIR